MLKSIVKPLKCEFETNNGYIPGVLQFNLSLTQLVSPSRRQPQDVNTNYLSKKDTWGGKIDVYKLT